MGLSLFIFLRNAAGVGLQLKKWDKDTLPLSQASVAPLRTFVLTGYWVKSFHYGTGIDVWLGEGTHTARYCTNQTLLAGMLHQPEPEDQYSLELTHVTSQGTVEGVEHLSLHTNAGTIPVRFHETAGAHGAVVWVGGAGGGLDGPAGGLYPRIAGQLAGQHIASLRLDYRYPNELLACVMDTLLGVAYLQIRSLTRVVLVGHSFGGAVVICAGALGEEVAGVAALSSQTYGTDLVPNLSPKPLLLMHGTADEILPHACSLDIYRRAAEPKEIQLYPGCRHGLDECRDRLDEDLSRWIVRVLAPAQ
jgi:hypothetical protein